MKNSLARMIGPAIGFLATAGLVHAHPGHEGHELTWDLSHLADHPLATLACFSLMFAAGLGGWLMLRRGATLRVQSLRELQPSRGK